MRRFLLTLGATLGLSLAATTGSIGAQTTALRILVLEGEGAVNIIQQNTAVAPVVEVRDRNNQPVAGATVRFVVSRGRATFNGARTLTATTNAAGRVAGSGFTLSGEGTLQITTSASYQGATTSVTISQTTVRTAAQAAQLAGTSNAGAASSAGSAGGSSGAGTAVAGGAAAGAGAGAAAGGAAGGGLSITTVAILGGAAAGGTIAGLKIKDQVSGGDWYDGPFSGQEIITSPGGCSTTMALTGSLSIRLKDDNGTLEGDGTLSSDLSLISATCSFPLGSQPVGVPPFTVTGTLANFSWTSSSTNFNTNTFSFIGSLTNNTVNGSLTHTITNTGSSPLSGSVTFPVALSKR